MSMNMEPGRWYRIEYHNGQTVGFRFVNLNANGNWDVEINGELHPEFQSGGYKDFYEIDPPTQE